MKVVTRINPGHKYTAQMFARDFFKKQYMAIGLWFGWIFVKHHWRIKIVRVLTPLPMGTYINGGSICNLDTDGDVTPPKITSVFKRFNRNG